MVRYFFFGGFLIFLTIFLGGFFPFSDVDFVDEVELDQADETGRGVPNPLISSIMTKMIKSSLYIASQRGVRGGEGGREGQRRRSLVPTRKSSNEVCPAHQLIGLR